MSGELVDQIDPGKFYRETSTGYDIVGSSVLTNAAGPMRGLSLQKINPGSASTNPGVVYEYYNFMTTIPGNLTITTGLTFYLTLTDDGSNPADLGTNVDIGITIKKLTSAVSADLSTGAGTEQTATATLSSTANNTVQFSLAIANANLNGAGAGDQIGVRIRRIGTNALDTCPGRVIMLGGHIKNT